mgnify:FL=1|tara:strand:+ start:229 stop:1116 length:888 start_codon:yes stop_codon:yes gene_type:complete
MGGGKKVTYNPPKIERDKSFEKYLEYQMERDKKAEERAATERAEAKAAEDARKAAGASGYDAYASNIQSQLSAGLISFNDAQSRLEGYRSKYDMVPGKKGQELSDYYVNQLLPGRRETGTKAAYEEVLGRAATTDELAKAKERFGTGYYSSVKDLKDSLYKGQEYQKKFNKSYLENYYDTQFGKQTTDASGERTGKRTFQFDKSLLPKYGGNLQGRTGITTPDFKDSFIGTPAEIQEQLQNVRDTRQYLYSAGLTNLQGEINKETTKLKSEGQKELQKIKEQGGLYRSLVGSFSF